MELQESQHQQNSRQLIEKAKGEDKAISLFCSKEPLLTHYGASLTISDTLVCPTIRNLVKTHGIDYMEVFMMGLLHEFLSFVPNALNADEIVLYAKKIISDFPDWSTADLVLCLKNGSARKYGPIKFRWTWASDFMEWAQKYNQEKDDFFQDRHVKAKTEGAIKNAELIKLFPKELLEKFGKEKFTDKAKEKMLDTRIPDDIIAQGVEAVDAWIEKIKSKNKSSNQQL